MFSTPILDVAITLVFAYLLMAIMVSAFNEIIVDWLNIRANMLKQTIKDFIYDADWNQMAEKILSSPQIELLKKNQDDFPSYINPKTFVEAFKYAETSIEKFSALNNIRAGDTEGKSSLSKTELFLVHLKENAGRSIEEYDKKVETAFNEAMERLTSWYKTKIQKIVFLMAFILTFALNVDTINIVKQLWNHPTLAKAASDQIAQMVKDNKIPGGPAKDKSAKDSTTKATVKDTLTTKAIIDSTKAQEDLLKKTNELLSTMPFPMGWQAGNIPSEKGWALVVGWISKIIGLLLTTLAISLGAPFWFDVLNKFVSLRSAGKKPQPEKPAV